MFTEEDDESRGSGSTITRIVLSNLPSHDPKVLLNKSRILRTGGDLWFDNPPTKRANQKQPTSLSLFYISNLRELESTKTISANLINTTSFIGIMGKFIEKHDLSDSKCKTLMTDKAIQKLTYDFED